MGGYNNVVDRPGIAAQGLAPFGSGWRQVQESSLWNGWMGLGVSSILSYGCLLMHIYQGQEEILYSWVARHRVIHGQIHRHRRSTRERVKTILQRTNKRQIK